MPTVTAQLRDAANRPIAKALVDLAYYTAGGIAKVQVAGASGADGRVKMTFDGKVPTPQPRMALRMKAGTANRILTETPVKITTTTIDFGTVTVSDTATAKVGTKSFFGDNSRVASVTAAQPVMGERDPQPTPTLATDLPHSRTAIGRDTIIGPFPGGGVIKPAPDANAQVTALKKENLQLKRELALKNKQIAQIRDEERRERERQLAQRDKRIDALEAEVAELRRQTDAETTLEELFGNTSSQIEAAVRRLTQQQSAYTLGDVAMELKVLPGERGAGFSFIPRAELSDVSPDILSKLTLRFNPREQPSPPPPPPVVVPDVTGYARSLALRKLEEAGFGAEIREEIVSDTGTGPSRSGRVLRQQPEAGDEVSPGAVVVLTLGRGM